MIEARSSSHSPPGGAREQERLNAAPLTSPCLNPGGLSLSGSRMVSSKEGPPVLSLTCLLCQVSAGLRESRGFLVQYFSHASLFVAYALTSNQL